MATEIRVPSLGESVTAATVARWLKQPGEAVARDEPIAELETDKATLEIPAPAAGVLSEILVPAGAEVPVGTVLGRIAESEAQARPQTPPPPPPSPPAPGQREEGRQATGAAPSAVLARSGPAGGSRRPMSSRRWRARRRNPSPRRPARCRCGRRRSRRPRARAAMTRCGCA